MNKLLIIKDGLTYVNQLDSSLFYVDTVITKYPSFPFGYYVKMDLLRLRNDEAWTKYANEAVNILSQTTKIAGHNSDHDTVLSYIQNKLRERTSKK